MAGFCAWLSFKIQNQAFERAVKMRHDTTQLAEQLESSKKKMEALYLEGDEEKLRAHLEHLDNLRESTALVALRSESGLWVVESLMNLRKLMQAGVLVGVVMSGFGFQRWYVKTQWFTDAQTKADFEDHMADLAAKRVARDKAAHANP